MQAEFPQRLRLHLALDAPPAGWTGVAGRLDGARVLDILGTTDADLFYVCGPEPMMASVTAALSGAGVPSECIRTERFAYATLETGALPVQAHDVLFAASGSRVRVQPGHTILEAALAAGVPLPSSCTMGGCGACKLHMREGSVVMRQPNCLSAREREEGYVLTCCAYPSRDVVIEGG